MEDYKDKEVLRRMYCDEGMTMCDIARKLYCSPSTIKRWLGIHGIPRRGLGGARRNSGMKFKVYVRVYGETLTIKELAKRAGVCQSTIRNRLAKGDGPDRLLSGPYYRGV